MKDVIPKEAKRNMQKRAESRAKRRREDLLAYMSKFGLNEQAKEADEDRKKQGE